MEHNMHANASLHWGYGAAPMPSTPQSHWVPPPQSHSLKRALSESDCEELYSEESSKEQISPSETGSCQLMSRKKRRGVIEKKRRDRINSSLSELKRLVPSAYEKQGSAKLEKAEILQLTVEHLKNLQTKGMDSLNYDPQRFAMEYHIIGFRECAAEVARYLVTIEGMDIQDPLRLRLMSHLQYFAQQRELSAKNCASPSGWTAAATATAATASAYQTNCAAAPYHHQTYPSTATSYVPNLPTPIHYPTLSASPNATNAIQQQQQHTQATSHHVVTRSSTSRATVVSAASETMPPVMSHAAAQQQQQQQVDSQAQAAHAQQAGNRHEQPTQHHTTQTNAQTPAQTQQQATQHAHYAQEHAHNEHQVPTYIDLSNSQTHAGHALRNDAPSIAADSLSYSAAASHYPVNGGPDYNNPNGGIQYAAPNSSKPYRPWGAEMAY